MNESVNCIYNCEICNGTVEMNAGEPHETPECCGAPMAKSDPAQLDACTTSTTAEHSRFDNFDDACDDGRAG